MKCNFLQDINSILNVGVICFKDWLLLLMWLSLRPKFRWAVQVQLCLDFLFICSLLSDTECGSVAFIGNWNGYCFAVLSVISCVRGPLPVIFMNCNNVNEFDIICNVGIPGFRYFISDAMLTYSAEYFQ